MNKFIFIFLFIYIFLFLFLFNNLPFSCLVREIDFFNNSSQTFVCIFVALDQEIGIQVKAYLNQISS